MRHRPPARRDGDCGPPWSRPLGNYSVGLYAAAGGPVVVNNLGTTVTFGNNADAVFAVNLGTTAGDTVAVYSGNAITHGEDSDGIYASGYNSTYVKSNLVVTYGNFSPGIVAQSYNGPTKVVSGMVHTCYFSRSDGITADSYSSDVSVTSGAVITDGDFSTGIDAARSTATSQVTSTYVYTKWLCAVGRHLRREP